MSAATFTLSAFGDEIADDLQEQLQVLRELSVGYLELRGVWGKNVLHLDDDEVGHSSVSVSRWGQEIGGNKVTRFVK